MSKITFVIPYIGNINDYQLLAIDQLSVVESLDVNLIIDSDSYPLHHEFSGKVNVLNVHDVFIENNLLGAKLKDILDFPYKLCDYKPFVNLLFDVDLNSNNYLAFGDLDCIFNPQRLNFLLEKVNDENGVYSDRGHFMIFGPKTLKPIQSKLFEAVELFSNKSINLLAPNKGYAIDEFHFLHEVLRVLEGEKVLKWYTNALQPYLDVDYQHLEPNNYKKATNLTFSLSCIFVDDEPSEVSYIHLQKRKVDGNVTPLYSGDSLNLSFDEISGSALFSSDRRPQVKAKLINKVRYYIKVLFSRIIYRVKNRGLRKTPSLVK